MEVVGTGDCRISRVLFVLFSVGVLSLFVGSFFPDPLYFGGGYGATRKALGIVPSILHWTLPLGWLLVVGVLRFSLVSCRQLMLMTVGALLGVGLIGICFTVVGRPNPGRLKDDHAILQLAPKETQIVGEKGGASRIPTAPLVMFLGGSTTEFLNQSGVGWPTMVGEILAKDNCSKRGAIERSLAPQVINGGRQWYTSIHLLINYLQNQRPLKPNVVVLMEAINDLFVNADFSYLSNGKFRSDYGHYLGPTARLVSGTSGLTEALHITRSAFFHRSRESVTDQEFPGLESFRRSVNTLIDVAMLDGATVVLMTQPHVFSGAIPKEEQWRLSMLNFEAIGPSKRWTDETVRLGMRAYNQALRDIANKRNVKLIDLEHRIPQTFQYFTDEVHYTDEAYPLVATQVAEGLRSILSEIVCGNDGATGGVLDQSPSIS